MTTIYFKNNDEFKSVQIDAWSSKLQKDEEIIWSITEQTGIFQKRFSRLIAITNFRIYIFDFKSNRMTGLLMMSDLDDIVVMNTYRSFNSIRYGVYGSFARGFGGTGGQSHGQSTTIGKIVFLSNSKPIISIDGISDPNGLKKLIASIRKSLYPKKELQRWMTGIKSDDSSIVRNISTCLRCGEKNVKDASFCSTCGSILK